MFEEFCFELLVIWLKYEYFIFVCYMKTWKYKTEEEYLTEEAIRLLVTTLPRKASSKKSVLLHSLRVWNYLHEKKCSFDAVIAGYLHDLTEDSNIEYSMISDLFGEDVLAIVLANTKNLTLSKQELLEDIVHRCYQYGQDALLVKAADVIDNYHFYRNLGEEWEMKRVVFQWEMILARLDDEMKASNEVFRDLEGLVF